MGKQIVVTRTSGGLVSQQNRLSAPQGGLLKAENCVCDRENVIAEKRRGMNRYASLAASPSVLSEFKDRIIALHGTTLSYDSDGLGAMTNYSGSYSPVDSNRMRFLEAKKCLYFATSLGIFRNDALTSTPVKAGMPKGLDVQLALSATTPIWFTNNTQVAYRVIWGRTDANNTLLLSAPTNREVLTNASGLVKSVQLVTTIPTGVLAGDFYEVYRTELSAGVSTDPGEEMFKLARVTVTSGDITAGTVTYNDTLDPIFLGSPLYTNPNEQTIDQENLNPPLAADLAQYKGYVFYLNTRREYSKILELIDLAALTIGTSTITFTQGATNRTYTAAAAENIGNREFKKETGLPTTSENIAATVKSLCKVINRDAGQTFIYARYASEFDSPPGQFEIRCRDFTNTTISITANSTATGNGFTPNLPTSGTAVSADNESKPNRLYHSKLEQPDAVPLVNYDDIGEEDSPGKRVIALQDSLIILMEEGVWRLTGDSETNFTIKPLDINLKIFAKDTAIVLDNSVFVLTDQGVVKISENGVGVMSWPTETDLKQVFSFSNFKTITHATAYNSDRKYILWVPESSGDTYAKIGYVFNYFTQKWTTWRKSITSAIVLKTTDVMYLGHAVDTQVLKERKSFGTSLNDFMDEDIPITINSVGTTLDADGNTVSTANITYSYSETITAGFLLNQDSTTQSAQIDSVTSLGGTTYSVVLSENLSALVAGAAEVALTIISLVQLIPETGSNPGIQKHFSIAQLYLETDDSRRHNIGFFTDVKPLETYYSYYSVEINSSAGWGNTPWGESPWGDSQASVSPIVRVNIPTQYQRCSALTVLYKHLYARERFAILSIALTMRPLGDMTTLVPR